MYYYNNFPMKYKRRPFSPLLKQKMASGIVEVPEAIHYYFSGLFHYRMTRITPLIQLFVKE